MVRSSLLEFKLLRMFRLMNMLEVEILCMKTRRTDAAEQSQVPVSPLEEGLVSGSKGGEMGGHLP